MCEDGQLIRCLFTLLGVCVEFPEFQCYTWGLNRNVLSAGNIQCQPTCHCIEPFSLSVQMTCYQAAEITIQSYYSNANDELSLQPSFPFSCWADCSAAGLLSPVSHCNSSLLPLSVWPFPFCTAFSFNPCLLEFYSICYFLVRWNIMTVLMIQQSFVYLPVSHSGASDHSNFARLDLFSKGRAEKSQCTLTDFPRYLLYSHLVLLKLLNLSWFQV